MNTIAHIINPFIADNKSDLNSAQPITFKSMQRAKEVAKDLVDVKLYSAQFKEDREYVPDDFIKTQDLGRSVLDMNPFKIELKLPLIIDILERLYNESEAEYLVFTNVDIGLYPNFYLRLNEYINKGFDAFIINRRRLPSHFNKITDLEEIYETKGKSHPGFDCFVFHRDLFHKFQLANICIGVPFIGIALSQNIFALGKNVKLFEKEQLTFHIGEEIFAKRAPKEYFKHNQKEFWKAINSDLIKELDLGKLPYSENNFIVRFLKWGLQPSIPIRLVFKLIIKKLFGIRV